MPEEKKSNCCSASVIIGGDDREGTHYYVCTSCKEPCDLEEYMPEEKNIIERFDELEIKLKLNVNDYFGEKLKNWFEIQVKKEIKPKIRQFLLTELRALKEDVTEKEEDDRMYYGYGWNQHRKHVIEAFNKFGIK
jgi:hypothetical protein